MNDLETELGRARELDVEELADAIETIGFECTRCGACCTAGDDEPHTATVYPDEVRHLRDRTERAWRDVARPMPYGLRPTPDDSAPESAHGPTAERGRHGATLEWALQTDACGDCTFYEEEDGRGSCTVHPDRPLVCRTYPFSVAVVGTSQPMGAAVDSEGPVRAHECEGLGREIDRADALELARALKERAIRDVTEAIAVRDAYVSVEVPAGAVVVHDSEGAKWPDGTPVEPDSTG